MKTPPWIDHCTLSLAAAAATHLTSGQTRAFKRASAGPKSTKSPHDEPLARPSTASPELKTENQKPNQNDSQGDCGLLPSLSSRHQPPLSNNRGTKRPAMLSHVPGLTRNPDSLGPTPHQKTGKATRTVKQIPTILAMPSPKGRPTRVVASHSHR